MLVVVTQQHLRHRQTHQLGVGEHRRTPRPTPACPLGRDDPILQLYVECDQKGVQVGVHSASTVDVGVETPIMDTLRHKITHHSARVATCTEIPVNDLGKKINARASVIGVYDAGSAGAFGVEARWSALSRRWPSTFPSTARCV